MAESDEQVKRSAVRSVSRDAEELLRALRVAAGLPARTTPSAPATSSASPPSSPPDARTTPRRGDDVADFLGV